MLFILSTSNAEPDERRRADERLVEHDADAVPVAGGRRPLVEGLLRRHVARGADHLAALLQVLVDDAGELRRHAEVEEHHAALGGHAHVRGLDVAMQLARRVERAHPLDELNERWAQAFEVRWRRLHRAVAGRTGERV